MSTTSQTASAVMDRSAMLLNDPARTDYTYTVQLPYLNMAIEELNTHMEEANIPITNQVSNVFPIKVGENAIRNPPFDLVEIQEVGERPMTTEIQFTPSRTEVNFIKLPRKEFPSYYPTTNSLLYWYWQDQKIQFNPNGANIPLEVQLKYIRMGISLVRDPETIIGSIHSISYLAYKTGALIAMFIGEDKERAALLEDSAEEALERIISISNKGKQQMVTRHRPFRAAYKMRGY